jgi:serine-type D-Ala-D-Ala carboxypeptidase (penicillin-binding protein 5/6)
MKTVINSAIAWVATASFVLGAYAAGIYLSVQATAPGNLSAAVVDNKLIGVTLDPKALVAKAAVLYDPRTGQVLYQKDAYKPLPLASLTKLLSVQTVLQYQTPEALVEITPESLAPEGDWNLQVGSMVPLRDLVRLSLVASSNDAIEAAMLSLGPNYLNLMNGVAKDLGLTATEAHNSTGLDLDARRAGATGSAYDMARLGATFIALHPDLFELTTRADVSIESGDHSVTAAATTLPLAKIPGFVAAKTGYTDLAGGNLVAVFDLEPGRTVVGVVLGSTREGRFTDMQKLIQAARKGL